MVVAIYVVVVFVFLFSEGQVSLLVLPLLGKENCLTDLTDGWLRNCVTGDASVFKSVRCERL
jgi:hypothetical protein